MPIYQLLWMHKQAHSDPVNAVASELGALPHADKVLLTEIQSSVAVRNQLDRQWVSLMFMLIVFICGCLERPLVTWCVCGGYWLSMYLFTI